MTQFSDTWEAQNSIIVFHKLWSIWSVVPGVQQELCLFLYYLKIIGMTLKSDSH